MRVPVFQPYSVEEDEEGHPRLGFSVPKELADGFINNKKENYNFRCGMCAAFFYCSIGCHFPIFLYNLKKTTIHEA